MSKVTVVQVVYNHRRFMQPVFSAIFKQSFSDFNVVVVISGNDDGGKEFLQERFPHVTIIDPGYNIGFAAGHNLVFQAYDSEFFQLVNPDMVMEPDYIKNVLKAFNDPRVGAATGKLLQCTFDESVATTCYPVTDSTRRPIIDTTGVTIAHSGRARDRGQHEADTGQYDQLTDVQAVSGAGPMYRAEALLAVKTEGNFKYQSASWRTNIKKGISQTETLATFESIPDYFDGDFHSYWEDVDLSWRMVNAGWKCVFAPQAVGYHGRGAGSSKNGYKDIAGFIRHHKTISARVKQLNYKNHIFMYLKNSRWLYPQFFVREFFMLGYILIFETSTLRALPEFFKLLPRMWGKRKLILKKLPTSTR